MDCDERYFAHVECAGTRFLFSRREFSCCDMWDTMVRISRAGHPFGVSEGTLNHTLNMSHNTAFLCLRNRTLLAIGGQLPDGAPEQSRWQPGILRRHADARTLPLVWSRPRLVASGIKTRSHCRDERFETGCDFDGKISAVFFRGTVRWLAPRPPVSSSRSTATVPVCARSPLTARSFAACSSTSLRVPTCFARPSTPMRRHASRRR